jgi:phospholipase C
MENKDSSSVIGQSDAPYENALAASCGLATNFHALTHPSPPNYLAATAGSTLGVTDDLDPKSHQLTADSIFGQLDSAGLSWKAYEESMPKNCDRSSSGRYLARHNPPAYFTAVRSTCATNDVPLEGNLQRDIDAGSLPSFTFITPNRCNDGHSCSSTIAGQVATGDSWLATWIPRLTAGPNYKAGNTLIVLTWDENEGGATNLIPTIVVAPSVVPGTKSATLLDQYGLLRTTEDLLHLPALGGARTATSMSSSFHL